MTELIQVVSYTNLSLRCLLLNSNKLLAPWVTQYPLLLDLGEDLLKISIVLLQLSIMFNLSLQ